MIPARLGIITRNSLLVLTVALPLTLSAQNRSTPTLPASQAELDSVIATAMMQWEVPGLAIVVVKGHETVLLRGYGTRVLGELLAPNADTYLQIASNSKTFTAYAIGMLVDEGRLRWDDPVKKHIPEFEVPDPYVTENIAIDDLLSHRSGLSETVLGGFQAADYTIDDLLKDIRVTDLTERFRSRNNYSQFGMALLGEIVRRTSRLSWGDFVRERIFGPLGMESSYTSTADFIQRVGNPEDVANIMRPAIKKDGSVRMGTWATIGTQPLYAPAGGIISTMNDMATWIAFRLNDGVHEGNRLISMDAIEEIRAPRIPADFSKMNMPWSYFHPAAQLIDVGYGQYSFAHRGRRVIVHNGGWMSSVIEIMPDERIGVGVFSNAWFDEPAPWASLAFVNAVALHVLDHFLGYRDTDWSTQMMTSVSLRK